MDKDIRHYYSVERVNSESGEVLASVGVDKGSETDIGMVIAEWEAEGKLSTPLEARVRRMTRLDAPLTDWQEEEIEAWIEELKETLENDDNCDMCGGTGTVTPNQGFNWTGECPVCDGEGYYHKLHINVPEGTAGLHNVAADTGIPEEELEKIINNQACPSRSALDSLRIHGYSWEAKQ